MPAIPPTVRELSVPKRSWRAFQDLDPRSAARFEDAIVQQRELMSGRAVWHVNGNAADGVSELLRSILGYARDAGLNAKWLLATADEGFHTITRRLYNLLYGAAGDGGPLGDSEREHYERVMSEYSARVCELVRSGDIVFLHDPPVAGLLPAVRETGAHAVFRSHLGTDRPNEHTRRAWDFLRPYVESADVFVFSRPNYFWEGLDAERLIVQRPSLDPFSPKNEPLEEATVLAILDQLGLTASGGSAPPVFSRFDGSPARLGIVAEIDQDGPVPSSAPLVAMVSGWERLKDQRGLVELFGRMRSKEAHLAVVGPAPDAVPERAEEREVLAEVQRTRASLPDEVRSRVHLVQLPIADAESNSAAVNAVQRRATVIVHKSLREGFGLSIAEAMWKERAVVASRTGGIPEQIADGYSGVLIDDPTDLDSFAEAIDELLGDPERRRTLGRAARERVRSRFLVSRHLVGYAEMFQRIEARARAAAT